MKDETKATALGNQLCLAARQDDLAAINKALDSGALPDFKDKDGWSAILYATDFNRPDSLRRLIEVGANIDSADPIDKMTPVMRSVISDRPVTLAILIASGADIHARSADHSNAATHGARWSSTDCLRLLVEAGVSLLENHLNGESLLEVAKENNWTGVLSAFESRQIRSDLKSRKMTDNNAPGL